MIRVPNPGLASAWLMDTGSVLCGLGHQQTYFHVTCSVDRAGVGGQEGEESAPRAEARFTVSPRASHFSKDLFGIRILNLDLVLPGHCKHAFVKVGG